MDDRQQSITLQQVQSKMSEAKNRSMRELSNAREATNNTSFVEHMKASLKAHSDYEVWKKVYISLTPPNIMAMED